MKRKWKRIEHVWQHRWMKYVLTALAGVLLVGFLGDNSVLAHFQNKHYINELDEEIAKYNQRYKSDMKKIRELNSDPKAMERIARERYFMKKDDEDIYVLSDDPRKSETNNELDETTE